MKVFYTFMLVTGFMLLSPASQAQRMITIGDQWLGNWTNGDTAIQIMPDYITRLFKEGDNWEPSSFAKDRFSFLDSPLHSTDKVLEGWIFSSYTSMRMYHKDEGRGETSIESVEYKAVKLELLGKNTLRISISKTYKVNEENRLPAVQITQKMLEELSGRGYLTSVIFKRQL